MTVVMLLWNYIVTPGYMEVPRGLVVSMLIPLFLPFNLAKGAGNTILALILYKPVVGALRRAGLAPQSSFLPLQQSIEKPGLCRAFLHLFFVLAAVVNAAPHNKQVSGNEQQNSGFADFSFHPCSSS